MKCYLIEKTFIGDDYCYCTNESDECFTISMCSTSDYYETDSPEFFLTGIYYKHDGWTVEKVEKLLDDKDYLFDCVKRFIDFLSESRRSRKIDNQRKAEQLIDEIKETVASTASTCWTLEEASNFSKIGINRLRRESLRKGCPWVLWIGDTKRVVKIDAFKEWLRKTTFID